MANKNPNQNYKDISYFEAKRCPFCKSESVIKWGYRYNHITKKQRYKCNKCRETFVVDDGFYKMKKPREFITQCIDLYVNGLSVRKVKAHIEQFSEMTISHTAIMKWLRKYSRSMKDFTDKLPVNVSGIYHADEIFVKVLGKDNYFWDIIDKDTRFLVSTHFSDKRNYQNAKILFLQARGKAKRPYEVYTDGLQAYQKAFRRVWYNHLWYHKVHYTRIIDRHDYRNNIVERIQGTLRERVKVMRGFGSMKSAGLLLNLLAINYNFIKIHQGIGCTPAEKCGIKLSMGKNKWLGLIYNSKLRSC